MFDPSKLTVAPSPPSTKQPNVFPLDWPEGDHITHELFKLSKREAWDPANLPWHNLKEASISAEERLGIGYWFSILGIFDAAAPPVFAHALIEMYKHHEEHGMRQCFSSILRDELNHEEVCHLATQGALPGAPAGPLQWTPKTPLEKAAYSNIQWGYYNGGRYWDGYVEAHKKYPLQVLFTSFLMGEVAATTLFFEMSKEAKLPVFQQLFRSVSKDEARHARMALHLCRRTFPTMPPEHKAFVTRQLRAGFIFLSMILFKPFPGKFWDLPAGFLDNHRILQDAAASGGLGIISENAREQAWRRAMLKVKATIEKFGIQFPAMPEVGLSGDEVPEGSLEEGLIPVF
ncbi:MAG: hypothetical protein HY921_07340 [Elusimicrobia bacterium]|nr:hypothetical protein [Elusimicrobiota bacterium]